MRAGRGPGSGCPCGEVIVAFRDMTATDAMGLAQRAVLDAWAFMLADKATTLPLIERIEDAARGLLGWCGQKRRELGVPKHPRRKQ